MDKPDDIGYYFYFVYMLAFRKYDRKAYYNSASGCRTALAVEADFMSMYNMGGEL